MDLSPNDIRNFEFGTQMRGYDKEEIEQFQEQVASALEQVKQENLRLSMEVESLNSQLTGLRQFEDTIKSAAIDARRNADNTISAAKEEAQQILSNAKEEAEKAIGSKADKIKKIESQIEKLELVRKSYIAKLKSLIESHVSLISEISLLDSPDLPSPLPQDVVSTCSESQESIEVTDSKDVTRSVVESIADETADEDLDSQEDSLMAPDRIVESSPETDSNTNESTVKGSSSKEDEPTVPPHTRTSVQKDIVETNSLAEEIPSGFISKESDDEPITDKINVDDHTEHNAIDPDRDDKKDTAISPEVLASELDEVVAKFEETMDEAASK